MAHSRRPIPRSVFAFAATIAVVGCGFAFRQPIENFYNRAKTSMGSAKLHATTQPLPALSAPDPRPIAPITPVVAVATDPVHVIAPTPVTANVPDSKPIEKTIVAIAPPSFLPPGAAAKFSQIVANQTDPANREKFVKDVNALNPKYPLVAIGGQFAWQQKLTGLIASKRDQELTVAVIAIGDEKAPDATQYTAFVTSTQAMATHSADAESAVNAGATWSDANRSLIEKTFADQQALFDDAAVRTSITPPILDEMRAIWKAGDNNTSLRGIVHDPSSSVPARVAAWQRLEDPALNAGWPKGQPDFVADQQDGEALILAADANQPLKTAIGNLLDRRLGAFYSTLTSEALLTDAITHLSDIEGARSTLRPAWFIFDCVLYKSKTDAHASGDAFSKFTSATPIPELDELKRAR